MMFSLKCIDQTDPLVSTAWGTNTKSVILISARVFGLPQSIEIDKWPNKKFGQGLIGVPATAEGSRKQVNSFPCSLQNRGELFPYVGLE